MQRRLTVEHSEQTLSHSPSASYLECFLLGARGPLVRVGRGLERFNLLDFHLHQSHQLFSRAYLAVGSLGLPAKLVKVVFIIVLLVIIVVKVVVVIVEI